MMIPRARAVTPTIIEEEDVKPQRAFRRRNFDQTANKRRKTNGMQATLLNEFDQEFGDVESLFLPPRSQHQERILAEDVRPGIDRLFLPYEEARRLRIPEVIWIYSFPGFQKCPLNIPDHQDEEEELLPKAFCPPRSNNRKTRHTKGM